MKNIPGVGFNNTEILGKRPKETSFILGGTSSKATSARRHNKLKSITEEECSTLAKR